MNTIDINKSPRVLLAEDDPHLGFLMKEILTEQGYLVSHYLDGGEVLAGLLQVPLDLCLLDVSLPTVDGFTLARRIRKLYPQLPFLFVTAHSLKEDTIKGYALGASDYVTKPFDEEILLCKVRAILAHQRRTEVNASGHVFQLGRYTFDYDSHALSLDGHQVRLTEKENQILYILCSNRNKVVRRDDAVERIYGKRDYFLGRSFDVFISKLRKHLAQDSTIQIENVYKVGFILTDESAP